MKKELLFLAALCLASVQVQGQTTVDSGTCGAEAGGSNLTWRLTSDSTLTISGTGDMADFTNEKQPWQDHLAAIRTAVVQEGVTSVGNYFLQNCTGLTSIDLPDGLTSVGLIRAKANVALTSLVYNISRYTQIIRLKPELLGNYCKNWGRGLENIC